MIEDVYLNYIAYFIEEEGRMMTDKEKRAYIQKRLGKSLSSIDQKDAKNVALSMYYVTHIANQLNMGSWELLSKNLSVSKLRHFLEEIEDLRKKYHVEDYPVEHYLTDREAIKHMKKKSMFDGKVGILKKYLKTPPKPVPGRGRGRGTSARGRGKTTSARGRTTSARGRGRGRAAPSRGRGRRSSSKISSAKKGKCKDYLVSELRVMAAEQKIRGRSTMKKAELCDALGLK
jgi:hypothetical protein